MNAKLALTIALAASGCIPVHDYAGDYDMTYDVVMMTPGKPGNVVAGLADVEVHKGVEHDYLVDLGAAFCRLHGRYIDAEQVDDQPYLDIRPQACWFTTQGKTFELSVGGTATYDDDDKFVLVLAGTFADDETRTRGTATIELTESW